MPDENRWFFPPELMTYSVVGEIPPIPEGTKFSLPGVPPTLIQDATREQLLALIAAFIFTNHPAAQRADAD